MEYNKVIKQINKIRSKFNKNQHLGDSLKVHLFEIEKRKFAYDINSASAFELDELSWDILKTRGELRDATAIRSQSKVYSEEEIKNAWTELKILVKEGKLFSKADKIEDTSPVLEKVTITDLILIVANDCNLRCRYCFADHGLYKGSRQLMGLELGKKTVDFFIREIKHHFPNIQGATIGFYGGEPLLNYKLITKLVPYAREMAENRKIKIRFHITTNGILLNEEIIEYLDNNNFSMELSLDGPRDVHDGNRCFMDGTGTFTKIFENVLKIAELPLRKKTALRAVVCGNGNTLLDQYEFLAKIAEMGFLELSIEPDFLVTDTHDQLHEDLFKTFKKNHIDILKDYLKSIHSGKLFKYESTYSIARELYEGKKKIFKCRPGVSRIAVDSKGNILACPIGADLPQTLLGNISSGISMERQKVWDDSTLAVTNEKCKECWAKNLCGGNCRVISLKRFQNIREPDPVTCEYYKISIECAVWLLSNIDGKVLSQIFGQ